MAMSKFSESSSVLPPSLHKDQSNPFVSSINNMEKVNCPDADKIESITLKFDTA
jgi:hypothetical protein